MVEMIKNTQDVAVSASPRQDIALVEGNKLPSPDKNEGVGAQDEPLTTENEKIQSERNRIFKRYRDSGGVLSEEAKGLLHPSWERDKKGGMSDERE